MIIDPLAAGTWKMYKMGDLRPWWLPDLIGYATGKNHTFIRTFNLRDNDVAQFVMKKNRFRSYLKQRTVVLPFRKW
jgi:hypothetical protein